MNPIDLPEVSMEFILGLRFEPLAAFRIWDIAKVTGMSILGCQIS